MLTADIMTTYGVSGAAASRAGAVTVACNVDEDIGARWAVYDAGMDIPAATAISLDPYPKASE